MASAAWALAIGGLLHAAVAPRCEMPVEPVYQTAALNDPDDPAIWIGGDTSLIIATDKGTEDDADGNRVDAALVAFRPTGELVQRLPLLRPNNVDVEYGLSVAGQSTDIAVTCERNRASLRVFALRGGGVVEPMVPIDGGGVDAFVGEDDRRCMGVGLYKRPRDGAIFAVLSRKSGPSGSYLWQYQITDVDGDGIIEATRVRAFGAFSGQSEIEAIAVDDAAGVLYYSDEGCCVRKYVADPDAPAASDEILSFGRSGFAEVRALRVMHVHMRCLSTAHNNTRL